MELGQIRQWNDAAYYLDMLHQTVIDDIMPLLETRGAAPHTICREVSCYIDYLGALYTGLKQSKARFIKYAEEVLRVVDPGYSTRAEQIYEMYRSGPVHEFDPKLLINSEGERLAWFIYRGPREDTIDKEKYMMKADRVKHLVLIQHLTGIWYLPISTPCLIVDLLESVSLFRRGMGDFTARIQPWNKAVQYFGKPSNSRFAIP